jgi:hypothetical protein
MISIGDSHDDYQTHYYPCCMTANLSSCRTNRGYSTPFSLSLIPGSLAIMEMVLEKMEGLLFLKHSIGIAVIPRK